MPACRKMELVSSWYELVRSNRMRCSRRHLRHADLAARDANAVPVRNDQHQLILVERRVHDVGVLDRPHQADLRPPRAGPSRAPPRSARCAPRAAPADDPPGTDAAWLEGRTCSPPAPRRWSAVHRSPLTTSSTACRPAATALERPLGVRQQRAPDVRQIGCRCETAPAAVRRSRALKGLDARGDRRLAHEKLAAQRR